MSTRSSERDFRLVLGGQVLSALGDAAATIALMFAVLEIGGSAFELGAVLAARYVPLAAFLLVGGVIADRLARVRLMIASDLVRALVQGVLAALLISGTAQLWQIVALQVAYGAGEAFFSPALAGLVPQLVEPRRLQRANALLRGTYDVAVIVGPGLGALLLLRVDPGAAIVADAATFALSALLLARLRLRPPAGAEQRRVRLIADLREGWRDVSSRRWLWVSITNFTLFSLLAMPAILVLGPDLAQTDLGGASAWSVLVGAFGAGALAGSFASLRLRFARPAAAVAGLMALAALRPAVMASGFGLPVIAAYSFAAGAAMSTASIVWVAVLQQYIPSTSLSRVDSIDSFGTFMFMPFGYLLAGPLVSVTGLHAGMVGLAAVALLVSLSTLACSEVRSLRWVESAPRVNRRLAHRVQTACAGRTDSQTVQVSESVAARPQGY